MRMYWGKNYWNGLNLLNQHSKQHWSSTTGMNQMGETPMGIPVWRFGKHDHPWKERLIFGIPGT